MTVGIGLRKEPRRSPTCSRSTTSGMPHYSATHLMRRSISGGRSGADSGSVGAMRPTCVRPGSPGLPSAIGG
ncbi:hypothetical protein PIB30_028551 [Stylosanthes scabra]|uniref:Uncharacterized protein n=1 Tax=Stylosanthes scabra TaxID=79078 RepID=A0ABU6TAP9_9FABA|nr:hypothetical protein [Stylosanthes scabra]